MTRMQPINLRRRFQLWSYSVSHRQLLLRSVKTNSIATRVDVLFKNVFSINLPTVIEELRVAEADPHSARAILQSSSHEEDLPVRDTRVFLLTGNGWNGVIVAGYVGVAEDTGDYDDPSSLVQ